MFHTQINYEDKNIAWTMDTKSLLDFYMAKHGESTEDIVYAEFVPSWHGNYAPNGDYEPIWIGSWEDVMSYLVRTYQNNVDLGDHFNSYAKLVESDFAYYVQNCLLDYNSFPRILVWTEYIEYELGNLEYISTGQIDYKVLEHPVSYNESNKSPYAGYVGWQTVIPRPRT